MYATRRAFLGSVTAVALAGCSAGGGGDSNDGSMTTTPRATASRTTTPTNGGTTGDTATVQVRAHEDLGDILVDAGGRTLYMFDRDTAGAGSSACPDSCADVWPPLTVTGTPASGDTVTAPLATFQRETGEMQVTAAGWPLYRFASDQQPGDALGQGVDGIWWVLRPDGTPVRSSTTTSTTTGSGYEY